MRAAGAELAIAFLEKFGEQQSPGDQNIDNQRDS
jgi:hypothetical protein